MLTGRTLQLPFGFGALVALPALVVFITLGVIFSIVAVLKVADGQHYRYPFLGHLLDRF